jgi:hypothetical protein
LRAYQAARDSNTDLSPGSRVGVPTPGLADERAVFNPFYDAAAGMRIR